jgi:hypothetical protein
MLIENRDVGAHNKNHESTYVDIALYYTCYLSCTQGLMVD